MNPAKTLALELLGALPVIAAEGPLAGAAATRVADQLATLAGLPVSRFPAARPAGRGLRRPRRSAAPARRRRRLLPRPGGRRRPAAAAAHHPRHPRRRHDGAGEREPRSAAEAMDQVLRTAAAHNVPVSGLAEHGDPALRPPAPAGPATGGRRLQRRLHVALALDNERALGA